MEKRSTLIGIFILILSVSFLFVSSAAKAESQKDTKKSLASVLNLHTGSLMELKTPTRTETARQDKSLKQVCIAVGQDLDAFVDFKSPYPSGIRTKNTRDDVRAVIGFHFLLP